MTKKQRENGEKTPSPPENDDSFFLEAMMGVEPLSEAFSTSIAEDEEQWAAMMEADQEAITEKEAATQPKKHAIRHNINHHSIEQMGPLAELSYIASGVSRKVERKLRKGNLSFKETLDLHGLTWKEAQEEVEAFLEDLSDHSVGSGLLIHGKGHGSVIGRATMKTMAYHYLKTHPDVLAVISARPKDGGLGAAYILVR